MSRGGIPAAQTECASTPWALFIQKAATDGWGGRIYPMSQALQRAGCDVKASNLVAWMKRGATPPKYAVPYLTTTINNAVQAAKRERGEHGKEERSDETAA